MEQRESKILLYRRFKVVAAFVALLLSFGAMASSSYAWLAISRTPIVSDLDLTVMTESRLEIALDENGRPGEWDVVLDLSSIMEDVVPLRPVTFSKKTQGLFAPLYGVDGRPTDQTMPLMDERNANVKGIGDPVAEGNGYYIKLSFWVRASQNATVGLSPAKEVQEGLAGSGTFVIGNPVWNGEAIRHENGGHGIESAMRMSFVCQSTDLNGSPIGDPKFVIYEPNCDIHADGSTGYVDTDSMDGGQLIEADRLIRQTGSTWDENAPVLQNTVVYSLGDFIEETTLFDLTTVTMEKVTVYLWVEARDVDCVNRALGNETSILACIQLTDLADINDTGIGRD